MGTAGMFIFAYPEATFLSHYTFPLLIS